MSDRRFLWRWSVRLARREWRQQLVIAALLGAGVAIGVGTLIAVFNLAIPAGGTYGTGNVQASLLGDSEPARVALTEQGHRFGTIEGANVLVSGTATRVKVRAQDPEDPVIHPLVDLAGGRWPEADGEVAITDGVARLLGLSVGSGDDPDGAAPFALGATVDLGETGPNGRSPASTVVGWIENPTDLDDEFILAPRLETLGIDRSAIVTLFLVDAPPSEVVFPGGVGAISVESSGSGLPVDTRTALTLLVNLVTLLALLEVLLLAGAGFAVVARRRSRQYGLLGAIGAGPAQIRRMATAGGLLVGLIGTAGGLVLGIGAAALVVPRLEESVGHRIDLAVPWWTVIPTAVLAVAAAGAAARWPTRPLATQPLIATLAASRPRSGPVGRAAAAGAVLAPIGMALLVIGAAKLMIPAAAIGLVLAPLGILLVVPGLIRGIARGGRNLPLPGRLAARGLDRQRGRSAAVIAALVVALGLPVGLVASTASIDRYRAAKLPNLTPDLAIAWLPGVDDPVIEIPAELDADGAADAADRLAASVPGSRLAAIEVAVDPDQIRFSTNFEGFGPASSVMPVFGVVPLDGPCTDCDQFSFGDLDDDGKEMLFTGHDAWVATPELLSALGLTELEWADGQEEIGLARLDDIRLNDDRLPSEADTGLRVEPDLPAATRVASVLLRPELVAERGWESRTVGWLLAGPDGRDLALLADELSASAGAQLRIEVSSEPEPLTALRAIALIVGAVTALAVLAAAIALEVAEGAADRQILRAIGADPSTARRMPAATAVLLALSGALLAVPVGYLAVIALRSVPGIKLPFVVAWPVLGLVLIVIPALAWVIGWVGAARAIRRSPSGLGSMPVGAIVAIAAAVGLITSACAVPGLEEPENAGADDRLAAAGGDGCDPAVDAALEDWADVGFSGSVVLLGGPRTCVAAYGTADRSTGRPNTVDTVFSIGSVTKAVTAAAVLDLIDAEVLDFDDPVGRHRTDITGPAAQLTIRQLLLHTSGLVGEHGNDHVALAEADAVAAISELDLGFEAGRNYLYVNAGYTLLALVIEAVTDEGYREYVVSEILSWDGGDPVGGFWDGDPAVAGPRAIGYPDGVNPGQMGEFAGPHWGLDGNGGVAMTAIGLARWTEALFTGEILSSRATDWLTSTTTLLGGGAEVELPGWVELNRKELGERAIVASGGGGGIGHNADVGWLPESRRVVVVAINGSTARSGLLVGHVVPALLAGTGVPGPPAIPAVDPEDMALVAGRWVVPAAGTESGEASGGMLRIEVEDGGIRVEVSGSSALDLVFPVPDWLTPQVADHERMTLEFVAGEIAEGRRWREETEAGSGPIDGAQVVGTIFDGELVTYVGLDIGERVGDDAVLLAAALNRYGGSEALGLDQKPASVWLVPDGEGGYGIPQPDPLFPSIKLRPGAEEPGQGSGMFLTVEGVDGTMVLQRADGADQADGEPDHDRADP